MPTTISGNSITTTGDINSTTTGTAGSLVGRNKVIGGDFSTNPWQRGTSFTAPASGAYTVDRFLWVNVTTAVVNILKTLDAPTAAQAGVFTQHCLHADITTADTTVAAGELSVIQHRIEGINAAALGFGQPGTRFVTLSFWHKHTKTGIYCAALRNSAGNRSYVVEYSQDVSDAWEFHQMKIPVDVTGTWLYNNGVGLSIDWVLAAGTAFQSASNAWQPGEFYATANQVNALDNVNNNFKIALVQLEAGEVATDFEALDVGTVLARCQRYYFALRSVAGNVIASNTGIAASSTILRLPVQFPVIMRAIPSLVLIGAANSFSVSDTSGGLFVVTSFGLSSSQNYIAGINVSVASGLTQFRPYVIEGTVNDSQLGFTAEL